jgi:hypothetical protein
VRATSFGNPASDAGAASRIKPVSKLAEVRRVFAPTTGKVPAGRTSGSSLGRSLRQPDQLALFDLSNVTS